LCFTSAMDSFYLLVIFQKKGADTTAKIVQGD